ncbi:MAG: ATP-binding cassette domain-containing protein [Burkholderiales bacterium]
MSAPLVVATGLRKSFGPRLLFDIGRLEIEAGRTYVLTGPNGSGKTTLLRLVAGLDRADSGEIRVRGEAVYVHPDPYLFHTSLVHNLEYGLRCRDVPRGERQRRVEDAIAWAGLDARRATPPASLSGGEKQRAALARARALRPDLLLLDEPTSNLDHEGRAQTLALLAQLRDERCTVVVACHDRDVIDLEGVVRLHIEGGAVESRPG